MKPLDPPPAGTKCNRCRDQAVIRLPSHNANVCAHCFQHYFHTAVRRAMKKFGVQADRPLLVAVSGGKDSLAIWDALHLLGYATKGLHVDLGIDGFSGASVQAVCRFARQRDLTWVKYSLDETFGHAIPEIHRRTRRKICSVCGLLKRQLLNRLTIKEGFQLLVTGHNLDDEAGRLLGNMTRHRDRYLEKQYPYLPSTHPRLPARLKPLYRLESHEIRTYCELRSIDPLEAKCPLSRGATSHIFKEALDFLEARMPGTKRDFLFTHVDRREPPLASSPYVPCMQCGEPTFEDICGVCRLKGRLLDE
jgi:tRNA-5-methyluridine54 2-sulfurtransferase